MSLTSWLTDSIPASGSLTLEWDPVGNLLVVRLRERVLWATGELLSDLNGIYNITYVSSPDEQYIYYTIVNSTLGENPRLLLHHDASLDFGGSFGGIITSYKCDGHSTEKGCKRWEGPKCRNKGDKFELRSIRTTYTNDTLIRNLSLSINDCKDICWNNCNCLGVNAEMDLGCQFLSGPYDEGVLDGVSFQVINRNRSKSKTWIWILISIVIALTIIVLLSTLFYLRRQSRARKEEKFLLDLMTSEDARELQTGNKGHNLNIYTADLIESATNGFSPENLLGKGGFGPVFKGTLGDGLEVAIKRLSRGSTQGLVEFKNELILTAKLQHTNLVRLLGFCVQGDEKMLVYEYLPNKSLDSFIFGESKRKLIDWDKRFSIIEGIAQGLLYLHKYSRLRIIHRDLKLSNILLDENLNPKISDFGMARIYKTNEAGTNTNRIVGTYGYMSPEYAMDGIFSEKSDVYSFGVMVLEVVSGRKNNSHFEFDRPLNLVGYAWELWKHGAALELMDPRLSDSCPKQYQALSLGYCFHNHRPCLNKNMFGSRVLVLILGCLWLTEAATNTLNHGDKLNLSDSLVSQNGAVSLGFHRLDYDQTWDGKEFGYYLAMYYTGDTSLNHSIWLANRDDPITDNSGVLAVDDTGLRINHTGGNPIQLFSLQSTSITISSSDMKLVLQDSENLVLQGTDIENGENVVLWQSFDHPTDTLLPEPMRLGFSHGRRMSLTSWLTDSIPASGSFTLEWDPVGNLLIVRLRERVFWSTGDLLSLDGNRIYNFTYVSSPDEQYLYYTTGLAMRRVGWNVISSHNSQPNSLILLFLYIDCRVENMDMDSDLYSNRSNDHSSAFHPVLFEKTKAS
ncbi:hypothetical protein V6N11_025395 [Hibiscus sabdariffa]|uniref:Receptor-like serine/threonine-protein kinase n=1 Tax=Hibiscus sabdariffa TaxID=183260 RepID=A0ABR1ZY20_9ROSI